MQKLVWINSKGTEINLTSGDYGITEWVGFSACDVEVQTQNVPFQDGSVFLDALLNNRELSVTLAINDGKDLEKRYRLRRELISALNPKLGEGYLIYTNDFISKRIKCLAQMPVFPTHNSDKAGTPKASLSWTACDPYWEDVEETKVFIPANQKIQIKNTGDVKCDLKLKLTGNTDYAKIINNTNKKKIEFRNGFTKDIFINTFMGQKQVDGGNLNLKTDLNVSPLNAGIYFESLNVCVIVGDNNTFYILNEEMDVSIREFQDFFGKDLKGVTVVNDYLYVCTTTEIFRTTDLYSWNLVYELNNGTFTNIKYDSYINKIIAYGTSIVSSADGVTWTLTNVAYSIVTMAFSNDWILFVTGTNIIYRTSNLENLSEITISFTTGNLRNGICYDFAKELFFLVTNWNGIYKVYYSTDGQSWIQRYNIEQMYYLGVFYSPLSQDSIILGDDGKYIIINKDSSYSSTSITIDGLDKVMLTDGFFGFHSNIFIGDCAIVQNNTKENIPLLSIPPMNILTYARSENEELFSGKLIRGRYTYSLIVRSIDSKNFKVSFRESTSYLKVYYVTPQKRFIAFSNTPKILKISEHGVEWTLKNINDYQDNNNLLFMAWSEDGKVMWLLGRLGMLQSKNSGETWYSRALITSTSASGYVIYAKKLQSFLFCDYNGKMVRVRKDYSSYEYLNSPGTSLYDTLYCLAYSPELNVSVAVGRNRDNLGVRIFKYDFNLEKFTYLITVEPFSNDNYPILISWLEDSFIVVTQFGNFYRSIDGEKYEYISSITPTLNATVSDTFEGQNLFLKFIINYQNSISEISENSNMNLNLEEGINEIILVSNTNLVNCILSYRQKYIGV